MPPGLCQIVDGLHPDSDAGRGPEGFGKANCHLRRNPRLTVDQPGKSGWADSKRPCSFRNGEGKGIEAIQPDGQAGVRWILPGRGVLFIQSVVADQFNAVGVPVAKAEDYSPIGPDCYGPKTLHAALSG